jgi:phosphatidylglycerophosphatase A
LFDRLILLLATGLGLGLIPGAPGTYGTLLGIPLAWVFARPGIFLNSLSLLAFAALSIWVAGKAEVTLKKHDAREIVIDEVAGMAVTLFLVPINHQTAIAGFLLFRFFDIVKLGPVKWANNRLSGGLGIVADDLLAGIFANLSLRLLLWVYPALTMAD